MKQERIKIPLTDNGKKRSLIFKERGLSPKNGQNYFKNGCSIDVFIRYKLYDYFDATAFGLKYGDRDFCNAINIMVEKIKESNE